MRRNLKLRHDWRKILRHAWSIRLLALAGILSGCEAVLPIAQPYWNIPPWAFSAILFIIIAAAFVSRIVAQKVFEND